MNENEFWAKVWTILGASLFMLFSLIPITSYVDNRSMVKMVELGSSPMEANCAIKDVMGNNISCNIIVSKGK